MYLLFFFARLPSQQRTKPSVKILRDSTVGGEKKAGLKKIDLLWEISPGSLC